VIGDDTRRTRARRGLPRARGFITVYAPGSGSIDVATLGLWPHRLPHPTDVGLLLSGSRLHRGRRPAGHRRQERSMIRGSGRHGPGRHDVRIAARWSPPDVGTAGRPARPPTPIRSGVDRPTNRPRDPVETPAAWPSPRPAAPSHDRRRQRPIRPGSRVRTGSGRMIVPTGQKCSGSGRIRVRNRARLAHGARL